MYSKPDKASLYNKSAGPHFVDLGQNERELGANALCVRINSFFFSLPFLVSIQDKGVQTDQSG